MSLRIWLPLTKDTRQQGLSNINVIGSPASWGNGKLGKCATWNGAVANVLYNNTTDFNYTNNFSVAFWANPIYTGSTAQYAWTVGRVDTGGYGYGFRIISTTTAQFRFGNGSYDVSAPSNEWHHFVMTVGNNKVIIYKDGVQVSSNNLPGTIPTYSDGNGMGLGCFHYSGNIYPYYGSLNDFRIYDHCLSPMEVKELAKGLVLHYPLSRQGWGQENLLSRYVVPGQAAPTSTAAGGRTTWLGDYKITIPATENADTYFRLFTTKQLTANATYTISCKVSGLLSGTYYNFPLYAQNNTSMGVLQLNHNGLCSLTFTMTYGTQTAATGASGETVYICFMDDSARSIASGQGAITVSDFKLEEGSIATPWCPNSSDALAITMGLNSTTEYDCSGFGNNLNKNGTYSYTSDTPKYTVSTKFNGTEWMNGTTPGAEILTLACWAKTSKNKSTSQFMVADSTSQLCISFYSGTIISFFGSSGQSTGSKCTLGSAYKENDWNHFVVVKTGTGTRKVYCNGIEQTATSNDYWGGATGLFIGSRKNSATLPFHGQICDVRAYATALSADDIKSLYQNSAYIDSSGNVYGAVHEEV